MKEFKKLDKGNIDDIIALTPTQEGILFHYLKDPESDMYFEQLSLNISGEIDITFFELAWNFVIQSNEMLRTVYHWENVKEPLQIVLKRFDLKPIFINLPDCESREKEKLLKKIKITDKKNKFDLRDVPFRVTLCKIQNYQYEMIISNHHILYDGWSNSIILGEFLDAYNNLLKGNPLKPKLKTKFKDYVRWLRVQDAKKQEEARKEYLSVFKARIEHPGKINKRIGITEAGNHHIKLPSEMKGKLEAFVRNRNITLASLLYGAWGLLLQHYNLTTDVLFDITVSGRTAEVKKIENMVGLFINTLPVRVRRKPGEKISHFLSRMHHMLQSIENYSPLSINEDFQESLLQNLFNSLVVLENYPLDRMLMQENGPLTINSFSISEITHYDLTVIITILNDIKVDFTYNKDLFNEDSMAMLSHHFIAMFREVLDDPEKTISQLEPLPEKERKKIFSSSGKQINIQKAVESTSRGSAADENDEMDFMAEGLVRIWEEVLGKRPGLDDDFFEIGGNSLELVRIYKQVNARYPGKIKVNDFFANPTIRKLEQVLISKDVHQVGPGLTKKKIRNINF